MAVVFPGNIKELFLHLFGKNSLHFHLFLLAAPRSPTSGQTHINLTRHRIYSRPPHLMHLLLNNYSARGRAGGRRTWHTYTEHSIYGVFFSVLQDDNLWQFKFLFFPHHHHHRRRHCRRNLQPPHRYPPATYFKLYFSVCYYYFCFCEWTKLWKLICWRQQ